MTGRDPLQRPRRPKIDDDHIDLLLAVVSIALIIIGIGALAHA